MSREQIETMFGETTVAQLVFWLLAAAAFIVLCFKLWPVVTKFVATVNALDKLPQKLALVDEIHHEVRPNTGTSLNDSVRRTEAAVAVLRTEVEAIKRTVSDQTDQINGLQELMEAGDSELAERVSDIESTVNPERGKHA